MKLEQAFLAWRKKRVTIEQVEGHPILDHEAPFSDDFKGWQQLKDLIQAGDELWTFRSPQEEWDNLMGWQGIVLVRQGRLVDVCVTAQN